MPDEKDSDTGSTGTAGSGANPARKPPASEKKRSRWRATNAAREALVGRLDMEVFGTRKKARGLLRGRAGGAAKPGAERKVPTLQGFDWAAHFADCGRTPRRVVQFWDKTPPEQIARMFAQTEAVCAENGFTHHVFDLHSARERIAEIAGPDWVGIYDRASHPAMQADVFRILELRAHGGYYMDADMALAVPFPFDPPPVPLFVQWAKGQRANVANWFLCTPPGQPVYDAIVDELAASIGRMPRTEDGRYAHDDLVRFTGPGPLSRALEAYLRNHGDRRDVAVMPVHWCHRFVQPGRKFLKAPMQYKREGLHWSKEKRPD